MLDSKGRTPKNVFNYKICKAFKSTTHSSHFVKPKPRRLNQNSKGNKS